jgi:hypothetical protein
LKRSNAGLVAIFSAISFIFSGVACSAETVCETSKAKNKPYGLVSKTVCVSNKVAVRETINLNGVAVLSDKQLFQEEIDQGGAVRLYSSGEFDPATGCAPRMYLLDMRGGKVRAIAFGVKNACNEFGWASWGDKRSVISLKKNVSFVYENGKLTPPKAGPQLWKAIEPPHAGPGLKEEDAVPFVQELALPAGN